MNKFCLVMLASLALALPARAGLIVGGTSGNAFQNLSPYSINENGVPYWDNKSSDGSKYNIGYYLTKTGGYATNATLGQDSPALSPGELEFWGKVSSGGTSADPSFSLLAPGPVSASLYLSFAGFHEINTFGWYEVLHDTVVRHDLFHGLAYGSHANYPLQATFDPTGDFGLFLQSKDNQIFYSDSSLNPAKDVIDNQLHQHFALFRESPADRLWVGVEDWLGNNDTEKNGDFNDMVVSLTSAAGPGTQAVPESASLAYLGAGVVGAFVWFFSRGRRPKASPARV